MKLKDILRESKERIIANDISDYWRTHIGKWSPILFKSKLEKYIDDVLQYHSVTSDDLPKKVADYWFNKLHGTTNENSIKQKIRSFIEKELKK